jgi:sec-independent protein translocase protein TatB
MFEFDAGKLVIIGIVALIVIGPKDLPRVLRQAGQAVAKLRHMAAEFQGQFMEAIREAELADLKDEAAKIAASAKIDAGFDPISELKSELTRAIDDGAPPPAQNPDGAALVAAEQDEAEHAPGAPDPGEVSEVRGGALDEDANPLEPSESAPTPNSAKPAAVSRPDRDQVAEVSRT